MVDARVASGRIEESLSKGAQQNPFSEKQYKCDEVFRPPKDHDPGTNRVRRTPTQPSNHPPRVTPRSHPLPPTQRVAHQGGEEAARCQQRRF